jgi:hypothetical protein
MIAMLLLLAAAAEPTAHISATATARIVAGARIDLAAQQVRSASAQPQRTIVIRQEAGQPQPLRLVEFQ